MRTRFAPSPTGPPHLGSIHTALFAFLAAKKMNGTLVIRVDDTDPVRSKSEWETEILASLQYLGITWDEGPDVGGDYGPYRQSERTDLYFEAIKKLKSEGFLYPCFCTESDLNLQRATARAAGRPFIYDRRCRKLSRDEIDARMSAGEKFVWRFHVDPARLGDKVEFRDLVYGDQSFQTGLIGDFVCIRSDGKPTYMLVSPLDDAAMGITHIIRGSDHLPNTPAQVLIMKALGYDPPEFAHLPLVTGKGGRKLSKRDALSGLEEIRNNLPAALINHLALLGWTHPDGKEILSPDEIVGAFGFERISTSPSAHDPARLQHLEREHLLRMSTEDILTAWEKSSYGSGRSLHEDERNATLRILGVVKDEITSLKTSGEEIIPLTSPPSEEEILEGLKGMDADKIVTVLGTVLGTCGSNRITAIEGLASGMGKKLVYLPLRIALTGRRRGFELSKLLDAFTLEETDSRLKRAIEAIEGKTE